MVTESLLPLSIELGLLAGIAVAAAGYFQEYSKGENAEKFSIDKFTLTVLIGGTIGAGMAFISGMDYAISLFFINIGIVTIIGSFIRSCLRMKIM
jgi:hypothetical protein